MVNAGFSSTARIDQLRRDAGSQPRSSMSSLAQYATLFLQPSPDEVDESRARTRRTRILLLCALLYIAWFAYTYHAKHQSKIWGHRWAARVAAVVCRAIGAVFGSILPTTVYLGHPIHKRVGATSGYSMLNALVFFFLTNALHRQTRRLL